MKKIIFTVVILFFTTIICSAQEHKEFHQNGKLKAIGNLDKSGKKIGEWTYYKENGVFDFISIYFDESAVGKISIKEKHQTMYLIARKSSSNKANFKIELHNKTNSDVVIDKHIFRCHEPNICSIKNPIDGVTIKKGSSRTVEIEHQNLSEKNRGMLLLYMNSNGKRTGFTIGLLRG